MPRSMLENMPLFMPCFSPKSSTVVSLPSSMPVTLVRSLFSSRTSATRRAEATDIEIMTNTMESIIRLMRMFMQ